MEAVPRQVEDLALSLLARFSPLDAEPPEVVVEGSYGLAAGAGCFGEKCVSEVYIVLSHALERAYYHTSIFDFEPVLRE